MQPRVWLTAAVLCFASPTFATPFTVRVATGLTRPVFATAPDGDPERLFIVEQAGVIKILSGGAVLARPFLDIRSIVDDSGFEQGLLGLTFDPQYDTNGWFYVYFTWDPGPGPGTDFSSIVRYRVSSDPDSADATTAFEIMRVAQPHVNHNGGTIDFGPDGYLYWALGDGGAGAQNPQNPQSLLGKIVRIDPSADDFPADLQQNYAIPPTNPFAADSTTRDEIWAFGLRNPYRWSFDRSNGDLYVADVGEQTWEEINWQSAASPGGENYGWRCYEANAPFDTSGCAPMASFTFPIHAYNHATDGFSCAVTGGYVYRGSAIPSLVGSYLYADHCSDQIYSFEVVGGTLQNLQNRSSELDPGAGLAIKEVSAFGEDGLGELYIVDLGRLSPPGEVYKIVVNPTNVGTGGDDTFVVLGNAVPNPFFSATRFEMRLRRAGPLRVRVYDATGRLVRHLLDGTYPSGFIPVTWDGRDVRDRLVPSGVYFVHLSVEDGAGSAVRKLVLAR